MSDDLLNRNLAALLTHALPDDGPSEAFRRRVALAVSARLRDAEGRTAAERPGPASSVPRPATRPTVLSGGLARALVGALVAATLLVAVFQSGFFEVGPPGPSEGPQATLDGARGPWVALGARGGPLAPKALASALAGALVGATLPAGPTWSAIPAGVAAFATEIAAELARTRVDGRPSSAARPGAAPRVPLASGADAPEASGAPDPAATANEGASDPGRGDGSSALWVQVVAADSGAPIERFRAWVKREVFVPEVATPTLHELDAPRGEAALPVPESGSQTLVIEAAGYAPWRASALSVNTADTPLVVALDRGVALVGSVLDVGTSAPVRGALVFIESALPHDVLEVHAVDLAPLPLHAVVTDAAGAFRIEHAPRGAVVLRASHADFAPQWSATQDLASTAPDASSAVGVPPIALESGGTVAGRVERTDGTPFEGAEVILSTLTNRAVVAAPASLGTAPARVMTYGAATTDRDGAYRIEHLPAGHFIALNMGDVAAGASMPRMQQTLVTAGGMARVDFLVEGARSTGATGAATGAQRATTPVALVGHLRDAELAPCVEVDLSLYEVHKGTWRAARTDAVGRFEFPDVASGLWAICRATRGFEDQQVLRQIEVAPDSRSPLEIDVTLPRGALTFVVQQGDGRPITSGRLALKREVAPNRFEFHAVLALHESGRTRVDALPDGRYRATLTGDTLGLGHVHLGPLSLSGEVDVTERCTLPRGGALVLSVRDERGGPAPAHVFVVDAAGNELLLGLDSRTDAGGVRRIPCLAPGSYTLEVRAFDGRRRSIVGEAREGETTELTVELAPR